MKLIVTTILFVTVLLTTFANIAFGKPGKKLSETEIQEMTNVQYTMEQQACFMEMLDEIQTLPAEALRAKICTESGKEPDCYMSEADLDKYIAQRCKLDEVKK